MAMQPCKDITEFIEKNDRDVDRILSSGRFRHYYREGELGDAKNDLYLHLIEKKFFETFNPELSQISTYFFTFAFRFFRTRSRNKKVKFTNKTLESESLDELLFSGMKYGDGRSWTLLDILYKADEHGYIDDLKEEWTEVESEFNACLQKRDETGTKGSSHRKRRSTEVLALMQQGKTTNEIAEVLGISRQMATMLKQRTIKDCRDCMKKIRLRRAHLNPSPQFGLHKL